LNPPDLLSAAIVTGEKQHIEFNVKVYWGIIKWPFLETEEWKIQAMDHIPTHTIDVFFFYGAAVLIFKFELNHEHRGIKPHCRPLLPNSKLVRSS
jgi:hypothetical protein